MRFTKHDTGCYADGAFGHEHVRERLRDLVWYWADNDLRESLGGPMPDDAWDEDEALEILNRVCFGDTFEHDHICFHFCDGDLLLGPVDEELD